MLFNVAIELVALLEHCLCLCEVVMLLSRYYLVYYLVVGQFLSYIILLQGLHLQSTQQGVHIIKLIRENVSHLSHLS